MWLLFPSTSVDHFYLLSFVPYFWITFIFLAQAEIVSCFQGVAMPAMNNILSKWVPVAERSRSLALVYSGMYLGSVTGLAFSPLLIHNFGWPSVFYSFGSLGTVWFAIWSSKVCTSAVFNKLNICLHNYCLNCGASCTIINDSS